MPTGTGPSTGNPCSLDGLSPACQLLFSGFEPVSREILFISHAGAVRWQRWASRTMCYFPMFFILHLLFCVHLPSCNLPPLSCSIYPESCSILNPASSIRPMSCILHHGSCIFHPLCCILLPPSSSHILSPPFSFLCPAAKVPG